MSVNNLNSCYLIRRSCSFLVFIMGFTPALSYFETEAFAQTAKINTLGWVDSPCISADGNRLYFAYNRHNFARWLLEGSAITLEGPLRPGHHASSDPWKDTDLYMASRSALGRWSSPVNLPFNSFNGEASVQELAQNYGLYAIYQYFYILPTQNGMPDIFNAQVLAYGGSLFWNSVTSPLPAPIKTPSIEDNPYVWPDGNGIWFTSDRPGSVLNPSGQPSKDIWFSQRVGGVWLQAVRLPPAINTAEDEDQFWVNQRSNEIYFNRGVQIFRSHWQGSSFSEPERVNLGLPIVAEASLPDDGQTLYFVSVDPVLKKIQIMFALRQPNGSWGTPRPVD